MQAIDFDNLTADGGRSTIYEIIMNFESCFAILIKFALKPNNNEHTNYYYVNISVYDCTFF